jgi:hypothetical protein
VTSALKALARIVALLVLIVAAVGSSRASAATTSDERIEEPALAAIGDGSCELEDEDALVVCGREIFGDLVDTSWLVMPEGQCSVLLDRLFSEQSCAFDDPDCHRVSPATPVPPLPKLQNSSSSTTTLVTRRDAADQLPRRAWERAGDDDLPPSLSLSPPAPPPRSLLG